MKTKLLTIAMTAALMLTAMTKVQAQNFEGPCLPYAHGLNGHQSAFCGSTETQTIELSEGYNWISTYIDSDPVELLQAIEAALGDNADAIEGMDGLNENFGDGLWIGDLDEVGMMNEQMYLVLVTTDCTVAVRGTAVNPEDHPITINPDDYTWIGFPCTEEMDIMDAFGDFDAEFGDAIEGFDGMVEYFGDGLWLGDFSTLVPGQGYLYRSYGSEPKTLTFPNVSEAKAKRATLNVTTPQTLLNKQKSEIRKPVAVQPVDGKKQKAGNSLKKDVKQ